MQFHQITHFRYLDGGVKFENNKFVSIVSYECKEISEKENIRYERPTSEDILEVKALVEENLGKPATGNILYHLDYSQLKHYADNEISQIFMYQSYTTDYHK